MSVPEKFGVVALKSLLGFVLDLVSTIVKAIEDGKFGIGDAFRFLGLIKSAISTFKSLHGLKDEISDLSDAEKADLSAFIEGRLDIKNAAIKGYVEQGLSALLALLDVYGLFKNK